MAKFLENAPQIIEQSAKSPLGIIALMVLVLAVLALVFFKKAPVKVRLNIFVLLFIGVAGFAGTVMWQTRTIASQQPGDSSGASSTAEPGAKEKAAAPASAGSSAQAGHLVYKLVATDVKPYATDNAGKPSKLALKISLRITDVMDKADYVDRGTIRLLVDGAELLPENSINVAVYAKQMVETDASFVIPAQAERVELLVGRSDDATAKIPIELKR